MKEEPQPEAAAPTEEPKEGAKDAEMATEGEKQEGA